AGRRNDRGHGTGPRSDTRAPRDDGHGDHPDAPLHAERGEGAARSGRDAAGRRRSRRLRRPLGDRLSAEGAELVAGEPGAAPRLGPATADGWGVTALAPLPARATRFAGLP